MGDVSGSRLFELYPDSTEDKLYIGGILKAFNGDTITRNITAFNGNNYEYMTDEINACWNGGCQGVSSIIRYDGNIIASLVRSPTYEDIPQIVGIGRWDGENWYPLDGGIASDYIDYATPPYYSPCPAYDFCIADGLLYVAGYIRLVDSMPAHGLASWNGTQWSIFPPPQTDPGYVILATSVAKYKGEVYLGGNFNVTINGEPVNDLIRYDGSTWHKVGDGLIEGWTNLHDLEVFQDKLIVAGYFTQADGNPGNSIMSWDGEHWDDMGGGICSPFGAIDDLFVHNEKLYVAGYFDCIGGIEAHNVAVWDGQKWCSIGQSVFDHPVHAIAVWRDTIYVGGSFLEINGLPARLFARYVGDHSTDVCGEPVLAAQEALSPVPLLRISPNPAIHEILLTLQNAGGPVQWSVTDALGRVIWQHTGQGDSTRVQVKDWPSGLYYCSAQTGSGDVATGRFFKP